MTLKSLNIEEKAYHVATTHWIANSIPDKHAWIHTISIDLQAIFVCSIPYNNKLYFHVYQ